MATRTLYWYEAEADARLIKQNGWNLHVAKSVAAGNAAPTYNLVWQSQALAPVTEISWTDEYALGWTAVAPSDGVRVSVMGRWQKCNKGESYDINPLGYWETSSDTRSVTPGWLNVGRVNYQYPNVLGIHIIVGVKNARTGFFEPVFVDRSALPEGSSAQYQPQETLTWWLEAEYKSGQVFSTTRTDSTQWDFTNPSNPAENGYEWSTSYVVAGNTGSTKWVISRGGVSQAVQEPPASVPIPVLSIGGLAPLEVATIAPLEVAAIAPLEAAASWLVRFKKPLTAAALGALGASLFDRLSPSFRNLDVRAEDNDGQTLRVEYLTSDRDAQGLAQSLAQGTAQAAVGGPQEVIDAALRELKASKQLDFDEEWQIVPGDIPQVVAPEQPVFSQQALASGPGGFSQLAIASGPGGGSAADALQPSGDGSYSPSAGNGSYQPSVGIKSPYGQGQGQGYMADRSGSGAFSHGLSGSTSITNGFTNGLSGSASITNGFTNGFTGSASITNGFASGFTNGFSRSKSNTNGVHA